MKDSLILRVRKDLCVGCGLCAESCPRGAISVRSRKAQIDQTKCNRCGICLNVCPQGAIIELAPVSDDALEAIINTLRVKTDNILVRIEKLQRQQHRVMHKEKL